MEFISHIMQKKTKFTKKLTACTSLLSDPKQSITLKMASKVYHLTVVS